MPKTPDNLDQFAFDVPGEKPNIARLKRRARHLSWVDDQVTAANKHIGAAVMNEEYAIELGLDQSRNSDAYTRRMNMASTRLQRACGECAIRGCPIREDIDVWSENYAKAPKRHKHIKDVQQDAEQGIERAC